MTSSNATKFDQNLDKLPESLQLEVKTFISEVPSVQPLLNKLISYLTSENPDHQLGFKKRKLESTTFSNSQPLSTILDVSFQNPRKKLNLEFQFSGFILRSNKENQIEFTANYSDVVHVLKLPTPDKPKPHTTYVIYIRTEDISVPELCILGIDDSQLLSSQSPSNSETKLNKQEFEQLLQKQLLKKIETVDKNVFYSAFSQQVLNKFKFHVHCYLKAKETFLYFLHNGIFFGFKKPAGFIKFEELVDAVVHGITSRTFNLSIEYILGSQTFNFEFGTIDALEYNRIADYLAQSRPRWKSSGNKIKIQSPEKQIIKKESNELNNDMAVVDVLESSEDEDFVGYSSDGSLAEDYDSEYHTDTGSDNDGHYRGKEAASNLGIISENGGYISDASSDSVEIHEKLGKDVQENILLSDDSDCQVIDNTPLLFLRESNANESEIDELNEDCDI